MKPGDIPLYEDAPDGFKDYLGKNGLKTGEFHIHKWVLGIDNKNNGEHHDEIAKDHPDSGNGATRVDGTNGQYTLHDYARALAVQATTKVLATNNVESNKAKSKDVTDPEKAESGDKSE